MDSGSLNNYPLSPVDNHRKGRADGEEDKGVSINNEKSDGKNKNSTNRSPIWVIFGGSYKDSMTLGSSTRQEKRKC